MLATRNDKLVNKREWTHGHYVIAKIR